MTCFVGGTRLYVCVWEVVYFFFIQNGSSFPGRMNMEKINSLKVYKNGCECEVG